MSRQIGALAALLIALVYAGSVLASSADIDSSVTGPNQPAALSLPDPDPLVVKVRFDLYDINDIADTTETFQFTGVLTAKWHDPRAAFDPAVEGVDEKIYTGNYQFDEISPGWYPQLILVNEAGQYQKSGVLLRVQPDGTSILIETINAVAESRLQMRRFPFDEQRLEAVFEVLGFDDAEVRLQVEPDAADSKGDRIGAPQWNIRAVSGSVRERSAPYAGSRGVSSAFVVSMDVERQPYYMIRIVALPLIVIVLLSFSVFWMDRSSLGDRLSVSFIGILTAVAYLMLTSDQLPRIAYFTLIHGFLNLSLLVMCATVVVNLLVGAMDKRGEEQRGDRLDRTCRWVFPIVYFGLLSLMVGAAFVLYQPLSAL